MRPHRHTSAGGWLGGILCLAFIAGAVPNTLVTVADEKQRGRADAPIYPPRPFVSMGDLALSFEENRGQAGRQFDVLSRGRGATLLFNYSGASVILRRRAENQGSRLNGALGPVRHKSRPAPVTMQLRFVGADARARMLKSELLPGRSNYLIGRNPKRWRTNISNYGKLSYANVYPGVDVTYYGNRRQLEYDFVVRPGGSPSAVVVEFVGANGVSLFNPNGTLATDITVSNVAVGAGGGSLTMTLTVQSNAAAGRRVVVVTTPTRHSVTSDVNFNVIQITTP